MLLVRRDLFPLRQLKNWLINRSKPSLHQNKTLQSLLYHKSDLTLWILDPVVHETHLCHTHPLIEILI